MTTMSNTEFEPIPSDLPLTIERRPDGITYTTSPTGVWKASKGELFFAIIWLGFMTVFTTATIGISVIADASQAPNMMGTLVLILFLAVFWLIGIALLTHAINKGKRYAIIDIVGQPAEYLLLTRKSIFGIKQQQWAVDEIDQIKHAPSGVEVNDVPIYEVQIIPSDDKKIGLLSEWPDENQKWFVAELKKSFDLSDIPRKFLPENLSQPKSLIVKHYRESTLITIPPKSFTSAIGKIIFNTFACLFAAGLWAFFYFASSTGHAIDIAGISIATIVCSVLFIAFAVGIVFNINSLIKQTTIEAVSQPDALLAITTKSIFKTKQLQWTGNEIDHITWGDSGWTVNDEPVKELQIFLANGEKKGLFKHREHQELAWIANELQATLKSSTPQGRF